MSANEPHPTTTLRTAGARPRTAEVRRVALSGLIGTVIEYYDFVLYSSMAALVFSRVFFPSGNPAAATIASLGTLAAGYLARPLGGLVFGHFGDRLGRKSMLVVSLVIMGVASTLIGLLPGYATLGIWAPALLVLLRLAQGVAVGGEYGGASLMVVEHAEGRRRGSWVGLMQMGTPLGALLATVAVALVSLLPEQDLLTWGWRIPFLVSVLLLLVGLYVRLSIAESPVFQEAAAAREGAPRRAPVLMLLRRPRAVLLATGAGIGPFALTALVNSHSLAYATSIGYPASAVTQVVVLVNLGALVAIPAFSALSDHIGRRTVVLIGAIGAVLYAVPLYLLVGTGSVVLLAVALIGGGILQNLMYAPMAPMLAEMFGTEARYSGVSLGYQTASLLGAGFTPLVAASLVAGSGGSSTPLSVLIIVAAGITITSVLLIRETRGRDLTAVDG